MFQSSVSCCASMAKYQQSYLAFFSLVLLNVTLALDHPPRVTLEQGKLVGKTLKSRTGRDIFTFQGIPYAAAPLGDLRFKPPQEAPKWNGERMADRLGKECAQSDFMTNEYLGEEDCLYINVYTPQMDMGNLSVMVWVHGGGFFSGSGGTLLYGPEYLLDHDIVLVTFNYRLGPLGFFSLGTKEVSGNYGLKDQVAALRWVQKNIIKFGGNPNSVTIFGESAGGASITYLMLTPLTKGLFHQAIAQSGSALNDAWSWEPKPGEFARDVTKTLGCENKDDERVLECLRKVTPKALLRATNDIKKKQKLMMKFVNFVPCLEPSDTKDGFLTEEPRELIRRGEISDVPFMTGVTTHEGMLQLFFAQDKTPEQDYQQGKDIFVPRYEMELELGSTQWNTVLDRINNYYAKLTNNDFFEQYLLVNSDVLFNRGVDNTARAMAKLQRSPVYYYQFSYEGGYNLLKVLSNIKRPGTAHADEIGYLFTMEMIKPKKNIPSMDDLLTIGRMTKMWTNFAKTGNPTPDETLGVTWTALTADGDVVNTRYLDIGTDLKMHEENLNEERMTFWRRLIDGSAEHDEL